MPPSTLDAPSRPATLPSREEALALLRSALAKASAEHVETSLHAVSHGATRFSGNAITQNISEEDMRLCVKAAFGQKTGQAETNDLSEEGIARAVARAEEIAKASAPDQEYLPPLPAQSYAASERFDPALAAADPGLRAEWVLQAVRAAPKGVSLSGSTATMGSVTAVANSRGLAAYHRDSNARFTVTALTPDSSGWAEGQAHETSGVDPAALAARAVEKARRSAAPKALEPGVYPVILEPAAVAEYLSFLIWSMGAKPADEGRSCMTGKLGAALASPSVTLASDPARAGCETVPFLEDGLPAPRTRWIDGGTCRQLVTSRFWGQKTGKPVTGAPSNLILEGGKTSLDDMIRDTERGVLVTRFWYIRFVDPMSLLLTGMTRDGLFWIEDGKIRHGLKNMRFNESPLRTFKHVEALGPCTLAGEYLPAFVPPVKVSQFTFSSGTTF
jgi:predicted Zn-dependent protease